MTTNPSQPRRPVTRAARVEDVHATSAAPYAQWYAVHTDGADALHRSPRPGVYIRHN